MKPLENPTAIVEQKESKGNIVNTITDVFNKTHDSILNLLFKNKQIKDFLKITNKKELLDEYKKHKSLQQDFNATSKVLRADPKMLKFASDEMKNNSDLVWYAIEQNPSVLSFASRFLQNNREFQSRANKFRKFNVMKDAWTSIHEKSDIFSRTGGAKVQHQKVS